MKKSLAFLVIIFVFLTFQPGLYAQEVNLAYGKPVTVSSVNSSRPESNIVDELENTYWQAYDKATEHWVEIDLGSVQSFNRVKLKGKNYIEYTISYDSGDGVWKEAYSGTCTTSEMSSGLYTIDFGAVAGEKVKLIMKNTSGQKMSPVVTNRNKNLNKNLNLNKNKNITASLRMRMAAKPPTRTRARAKPPKKDMAA